MTGGCVLFTAYQDLLPSSFVVSNSIFSDSTAMTGAAVAVKMDTPLRNLSVSFERSSFRNCTAQSYGGALYFETTKVSEYALFSVYLSNFTECISNSYGGAIAVRHLENSIFTVVNISWANFENSSGLDGGGGTVERALCAPADGTGCERPAALLGRRREELKALEPVTS